MGWLKKWRRRKLDKEPFPEIWERILGQQIHLYRQMSRDQKKVLRQLVHYFLAEKSFEGCGGLELDDTKRVTIAAMACIPLIGGVSDLYPYLTAVLVYPEMYHAPYSEAGVDGVVSEGVESRRGESWDQGVIVLSWDEVAYDVRNPRDGSNIVMHECAHQLDYEWGATMEDFSWQQTRNQPGMALTLKDEYQRYVASLRKTHRSVVDDYAATNIHEFFAVMSETWFERPDVVRRYFPRVDRVFSDFYNLEPDFGKFGIRSSGAYKS